MNNPWSATKKIPRWKLKNGKVGGLQDFAPEDITEKDVEEAKKLPAADKEKLKMQYFLDQQKEENDALPDNVPRKYRNYRI